MKKTELETIRKMNIPDISLDRSRLFNDLINEKAKIAQSGQKNSKTIRDLKKKIAWEETVMFEKVTEESLKQEVKHVK
ncbi:MAG: hypothetical protein NTZ65_01570 [Candidatus Berkelbacteria bacterium]|nr:hypothetical protein [Candidatus Berkelbacteria bacterium]